MTDNRTRDNNFTVDSDTWCHTRETISMLYLAICQIETSIEESNQSVQQLTETFTRLAAHTLKGKDSNDQTSANPERLTSNSEIHTRINDAITAFQFYDRISQRLDHVARGLGKMTEIFNDGDKLNDPNTWKQIQNEVKSSYSMESERLMFDKIMDGATIEEARSLYQELMAEQKRNTRKNDIEFF